MKLHLYPNGQIGNMIRSSIPMGKMKIRCLMVSHEEPLASYEDRSSTP